MNRCIVLNGDYTFLNTVNWRRAVTLIMSGKAEALKYTDKILHCVDGSCIRIPSVMKLLKVIRMIYKNRVPYSKKNVMFRDGFACVYCGAQSGLTIDHVIPQSRGGKNSFENCVTSCFDCNNKKGNRTPNEANMYMKRRPYAPTISEFFRLKMKQMGLDKFLKELGVF
jgi:5-methylcytosine-specific restriction endonuclease McrA